MDGLPKPCRGVKPANPAVRAPTAGAIAEPATPYVVDQAGLPALGGALSRLSNDSGVLQLVREGLPFSSDTPSGRLWSVDSVRFTPRASASA